MIVGCVRDTSATVVAFSQNGKDWSTPTTIGYYGQIESMMYGNGVLALGTYPNLSNVASIVISRNDGLTWQAVGGTADTNYHHYGSLWTGNAYLFNTDASNNIQYSYDGINWSWNTGSAGLSGKQLMWTKPHIGYVSIQSPVVIIGTTAESSGNMIGYSENGLNYKMIGVSPIDTVSCIGWNGYIWIAGGEGLYHTLCYSVDGYVWEGIGKTVVSGSPIADIKWNGKYWLLISVNGYYATSTDGIVWTERGNSGIDMSGQCIAWNGFNWLSGGVDGVLAKSTDGISWTSITQSILDVTVNDIQWIGDRWLAVGDSVSGKTIMYTTDETGMTGWTESGSTTSLFTIANKIQWNGKTVMVAGQGTNTVVSSTDQGATWTGYSIGSYGNTIIWNDKYWIMGGDQVEYSNGVDISWNDLPADNSKLGYRDWETDRKSTRLNSSHRL